MEDNDTSPLIPQPEKYRRASYSEITSESKTSSLHETTHYGVISQGEIDTNGLPQTPSASDEQEFKIYKRRWYILLLFSLLVAINAYVWNTWGPISNSVKKAFNWTNGDISLFANWGPITQVSVPIFVWLLDTRGLRWSVVVAVLCVTLGAGVRCIPVPQPSTIHKWLIHAGQMLNGMGGPVTCLALPALSATWFPPQERATATAIPLVSKFVTLAGSYIIGPLLVPDISKQNGTDLNITTYRYETEHAGNNNSEQGVTVDELKKDITFYLQLQVVNKHCLLLFTSTLECLVNFLYHNDVTNYILPMWHTPKAGVTAVVFLMILVYFPKKPPTPPCASASVQREAFFPGLKLLLRKSNFWLMVLITVLVLAFNNVWMAVLSVILIPVGASQKDAGWIGFYSLMSVGGSMLVFGRLGDIFANRMKWFISSLYFIAAAMSLWFTLIYLKVLPYQTAFLYVSIIVSQTAINTPFPLVLELSCDLAYPVGEGTSAGIVNGAYLIFSAVLFFTMMIPHIGTVWLNYSVVSALTLSTVLVLLVKEKHHRLDIDVAVQRPINTSIRRPELSDKQLE